MYYRLFIKASTAEVPEGEAVPDVAADLNARLAYQLGVRTSLKEGIIQVLCGCIDTVIKQQLASLSSSEEESTGDRCRKLIQQLNLRQLISFDIVLKHDVCTEHCKQLKKTTAIMIFKIASPSPLTSSARSVPHGFTTKRIECSLDEVKRFREEMLRV